MQKTVYEDYKYCMQDTSRVYVGCKYTFGELLETDSVPFKLQLIMQKYILSEADLADTLETHFYYLQQSSFLVKIYTQLKARVKVSIPEEKKSLLGGVKRRYVTKVFTVEQLVKLTPEEKEAAGMMIQEFSVSKLAMTAL